MLLENDPGIISSLQEIKKQIEDFKKITKKYYRGHPHYKQKLKKYKLELTGDLKKLRNFKSDKTSEIDSSLLSFLAMTYPNKDNCEELISKLEYTIQDLELLSNSEEEFIERIYDVKSPFDFHNDLRDIIKKAGNEIFIIEPYIDEDILEITLRGVNPNLKIRILSNSNNHKGNFVKVSNKFSTQHKGFFETREGLEIHDRVIFRDNRDGWVIGQSINSAAKNKPTYLIKLKDSKKLETIYQRIWNTSSKVK